MKSAMNTVPSLALSPFSQLQIGPSPIMNSVVSESVNGFLNTTSASHSEVPRRNSFAPPISTSTHSLIKLNSTAAEGPRLNLPPGKPHSPAPPSATTASGSFSFSSAAAMVVGQSKATTTPTTAHFVFITRAPELIPSMEATRADGCVRGYGPLIFLWCSSEATELKTLGATHRGLMIVSTTLNQLERATEHLAERGR